ncbi:MAG: glycosyltransferase family 39 protein [Patescibacteria group bacterium]|nr:glycosyltransferase family 39 protein [Patescibacteria group bacterium]
MSKIKNLLKLEVALIISAFIYYLFFVNKGLVFFDEGYFAHSAERLLNGQMPYKDFSLQYGPTYFYILAFLFKLFGPSILIGRFLNIVISLFIILTIFFILKKLKINSRRTVFLSFLSLTAFGYPLINISNIVWISVLLSLLSVLTYIYWLSSKNIRQYRFLVILGLLLALSISCKQNFGLAFVLLFTLLVVFGGKETIINKFKNLVLMNGTWILATFVWVYYFFLKSNLQGLFDFINYGRRFAINTAFSYPPLTYLLQPLGIFKLLPYYLPVILFFIVLMLLFKKYRNWSILAFSLTAIVGFFVSVYPQSDLLHVYPFFGMILVSFLLFPFKPRLKYLVTAIVLITILTGFYLSIFMKSYRYESYYYQYTTYLNLPRTQGILVTKYTAENVMKISKFINTHTSKKDYIFAYPYSPMLYFILERKNPSKDAQYFLPIWHFYDDKVIISEIKNKKVKYIIVDGAYKFDTDLSKFIENQKKILDAGQFQIFEIRS